MRNVLRSVWLVAVLLPLAGWTVPKEPHAEDSSLGRTDAGSIKHPENPDHAAQARVMEAYGKLPLTFEANHGQMDSDVKFFSRGSGYGIFLTPTEAILNLSNGSRPETKGTEVQEKNTARSRRATGTDRGRQTRVLRMRLVGANPEPQLTGEDELPG